MRTNTQEAVLSAYIASIGKRTSRDAARDAAELCRLANSLNRLNEIACNHGLTERQERRTQDRSGDQDEMHTPKEGRSKLASWRKRREMLLRGGTGALL